MTFTNTIPMTFGILFPLFNKYWDIVTKRGTQHTSLEVEILLSHLFMQINGILKN